MIRDEYNKSQEIRKKSAKEIEGVKKLGERAYYSMSIKKLTNSVKALNFNTWFTLILVLGLLVIIVVLLVLDFSLISKPYIIIAIALISVILSWGLAWFLFVKRMMLNKIVKYHNIIEGIKTKEMEKQKNIYKIYTQNTK